jgi:bifunctional DNase/RNase
MHMTAVPCYPPQRDQGSLHHPRHAASFAAGRWRREARGRAYVRPLWALLGVLLASSILSACRSKDPSEIEVEVRSVGFDSASRSPVVVLQDQDRKVALPIWIGPAEAQSIAMQLEGIDPPRPLTHDLMKSILDGAGVEFQKAVIQELKGSTYYARIYLQAGRHDIEIDSRPSDAIALAVRFKRPIFVSTALMRGETSIDLLRDIPGAGSARLSGVTVQNLSEEIAEYFSLPPGRGVLVADVEGEGAEGLRRGDVILDVDGEPVSGVGDFEAKVHGLSDGGVARLGVHRSGERIEVSWQAPAE